MTRSLYAAVLTFLIGPAMATENTEREALARLERELELLSALIEEAQSHADNTQRLQFDYPALRGDLAQVRLGIQEYLSQSVQTPYPIVPLEGAYTHE